MDKKPPYELPLRITKEDKQLLRQAFRGNDALMKVMIKMFLPTGFDPDLPVEYISDIWGDRDFAAIPNDEVKAIVLARQDLIKYVRGTLSQIKLYANTVEETADDVMKRIQKNSSQ